MTIAFVASRVGGSVGGDTSSLDNAAGGFAQVATDGAAGSVVAAIAICGAASALPTPLFAPIAAGARPMIAEEAQKNPSIRTLLLLKDINGLPPDAAWIDAMHHAIFHGAGR